MAAPPREQPMPQAAAMLTHGGFGTPLFALSAGVPIVVIPLFADDQYVSGRRVRVVGPGLALGDGRPRPGAFTTRSRMSSMTPPVVLPRAAWQTRSQRLQFRADDDDLRNVIRKAIDDQKDRPDVDGGD